jgi:decaprenylphospho-beta-D-ribofuranose 2-oxidase
VAVVFAWVQGGAQRPVPPKPVINDVSGLNPTTVLEIVSPTTEAEIQETVQRAIRDHKHISIAGKRHSQGGQTAAPNAILIDMTRFNQIRYLDRKTKVITVESGATWAQVQDYANQYGLAVEVQQASNIFTVGGSLGVNCHGRDPNFGSLIQTVRGFRLVTADGSILRASRDEHGELFSLVIGGYGLFGVVLDVELQLTDNAVYEKHQNSVNYRDYPLYFEQHVRGHPEIGLHYAWPSVRRKDFLQHFAAFSFVRTDKRPPGVFNLQQETHLWRNRVGLAMSRRSKLGKDFRWYLQETFADRPDSHIISRNNAMRPEVAFLAFHSSADSDILQEYFVPVSRFVAFMDRLRHVLLERDVNLLSATVRFVPRDQETFLSYAREDSFALVLYINQELSESGRVKAQLWTRELVDAVLAEGGTYYLPYQRYPTQEQIRRAYPNLETFFELKRRYDLAETFFSSFYEYYAHASRQ